MSNDEKINYSKQFWDVKNSGKRLLYKLSPMKNGKYSKTKKMILMK